MAIIKADHRLEDAKFSFNESGDVSNLTLMVNYAFVDDDDPVDPETGKRPVLAGGQARVTETKSVWGQLSGPQQAQADTIGKRLQNLANQF